VNSQVRRVIGIDHGVQRTGWGIVYPEGGQFKAQAFGAIETDSQAPFDQRLKQIYDALTKVIAQYQPQEMAVEEAIYAQNVKTALLMGQARGTVLLAGANAGLPIFAYTPKKIKSATVGNGAASKEQVQFMVRRILNLTDEVLIQHGVRVLGLDVSDALAVAICHLQQARPER
jgi:crossover junction endodeoxyribonuclease RuvC